ncbi:gliding motility-associated ABC transporter substrate-binding protein GldG [Neolewinella aurantiaca]|uniref:Gliding motility-associated ABC transporter substrate-binding protein GldG n=1 Tax=Neolewinella aurantiaca TaxID=2602767 RepID=A0A5C7FFJ4_9BACT|nr:gliding motility-associated ABC transporter substrate-binding protein GldG [Neolewinella aurantiaca]TXF88390.1 gliding motility-associated ABC transporter substrate-binding protein GldG [Neolewinella aurantiaca]
MAQLEHKHRTQSLLQFGLALALLVIVNVLANARFGDTPLYGALDLTEDKRFTLTDNTIEQLNALQEPLFVRVLLTGNLPVDFQRLADKAEETLIDFAGHNDLLEYEFADPLSGTPEQRTERQKNLAEEGIVPETVYSAESAAERSATVVYPYAIFYYGGRTRIVPLLQPSPRGFNQVRRLNKAEALMEYNFSRAIESLTNNDKPLIGFTVANGEIPPANTGDLVSVLRKDYEIGPVVLDSFVSIPQDIKLLIVAKPTVPFEDFEVFKLDQYVMNGGKILWAIDNIGMDYDSLQGRNEFYPLPRELGLDELFFKYGIRMTPVLGLDLSNTQIPIRTGTPGGQPKIEMTPFPYHVLAVPQGEHPIIKNLDPVDLRFPTVIETVNDEDPDITKTLLLKSSPRSRRKRLPSSIDLDAQKYQLDLDRFNEDGLPFAYLLEGRFKSPYANRLSKANEEALRQGGLPFRKESDPTRMVVIADGDILSNPVIKNQTYSMGYNIWQRFTYANKPFILNAIEYLLDPEGVISARGKDVKLRLLDREAALADSFKWQTINILVPLFILALFGLIFNLLRRRKYARK